MPATLNKRIFTIGPPEWAAGVGALKPVLLIFGLFSAICAFAVEPVSTLPPKASEDQVVQGYLQAVSTQQTILLGVSMEVEIDASVPKLEKKGKLHALRNISKLGKVTYRMIGFLGDNSVKKEVIARYLAAEVQAQSGPNIGITPNNYKFKYINSKNI